MRMRVLIVDDEAANRDVLAEIVKKMGHDVDLAEQGRQALDLVQAKSFDLILSDMRMPLMDGRAFFESARQILNPCPPFVFMTAYGRIEEAVDVLRQGALHFLTKPIRKKEIVSILEEVAARKDATQAGVRGSLPEEALWEGDAPVIVSRSMQELIELTDRVAASQASVLLTGESGSGKEVLARRLHSQSARASGPFVVFHAGAVPETLIESELFGYERGAFTGADRAKTGLIESAHQGTFFIDEVGTMPLGVQAKLLRVLQDKKVQPLGSSASIECDVRYVAATNERLDRLVAEGRFREDLLYRLRVVELDVPPLRERPEDILPLARRFLSLFARAESRPELALTEDASLLLTSYPWPGNVRELRNVIERAVAIARPTETALASSHLPAHISQPSVAREIRVAVGMSLQSVEDRLIEETLKICNGDKAKAALVLGVAPRTIYRWIERREPSRSDLSE